MEKSNNDLIEENKALKAKVIELESDLKEFTIVVKGILKALGLLPLPENVMKTIIKKVPSIISRSVTDSRGLEKDFDFLVKVKPLIEKYINKESV